MNLHLSLPRRHFLATLAFAACGLSTAHAQGDYPTRTIRLIVPFATAGVTDTSARIVADKLSQELGQTVIVDNKPGAAGNIGTQMVARAEADGYTLLLAYDGTLVINPNVYQKVPFDPIKDFAPIGKIGDAVLMVVVNPKLHATKLSELETVAKATAGGLSYGSAGNGSTTHLAGEMLKQRTGMPLVHVPYKGGGASMGDVVSGVLPMTFAAVAGAVPFIQSGQVRPIAVASRQRVPSLPDVPTFIESGLKDFEINSWVGLAAPAKTPQRVITRLNLALNKVLNSPDVRERLGKLGIIAQPGTPEAFGQEIVRDLSKNKAITKAADIRID